MASFGTPRTKTRLLRPNTDLRTRTEKPVSVPDYRNAVSGKSPTKILPVPSREEAVGVELGLHIGGLPSNGVHRRNNARGPFRNRTGRGSAALERGPAVPMPIVAQSIANSASSMSGPRGPVGRNGPANKPLSARHNSTKDSLSWGFKHAPSQPARGNTFGAPAPTMVPAASSCEETASNSLTSLGKARSSKRQTNPQVKPQPKPAISQAEASRAYGDVQLEGKKEEAGFRPSEPKAGGTSSVFGSGIIAPPSETGNIDSALASKPAAHVPGSNPSGAMSASTEAVEIDSLFAAALFGGISDKGGSTIDESSFAGTAVTERSRMSRWFGSDEPTQGDVTPTNDDFGRDLLNQLGLSESPPRKSAAPAEMSSGGVSGGPSSSPAKGTTQQGPGRDMMLK